MLLLQLMHSFWTDRWYLFVHQQWLNTIKWSHREPWLGGVVIGGRAGGNQDPSCLWMGRWGKKITEERSGHTAQCIPGTCSVCASNLHLWIPHYGVGLVPRLFPCANDRKLGGAWEQGYYGVDLQKLHSFVGPLFYCFMFMTYAY